MQSVDSLHEAVSATHLDRPARKEQPLSTMLQDRNVLAAKYDQCIIKYINERSYLYISRLKLIPNRGVCVVSPCVTATASISIHAGYSVSPGFSHPLCLYS